MDRVEQAEHNTLTEDLTNVYPALANKLIALADKHNAVRDDIIKFFAAAFSAMVDKDDGIKRAIKQEIMLKIYPDVVSQLIALADKHDYERDDVLKYFSGNFSTMANLATFANWRNTDGQD